MLTEIVRAFDGMDIETADSQGAANTIWVDSRFWPAARDRNLCVVHLDVQKIAGTGATVTIVAEDSSGRIFVPIGLSSNTRTSKGLLRLIIKDFGANLKLGVQITATSVLGSATFGLEYTLKAL